MPTRNELSIAAALLSAGAAAIHASVAGPHFDEAAVSGLLFVATAVFQAGWAALVLAAPSHRLLGAGVVVNAGVIGAWAVSRTFGLPYGPEPWTAEPVAPLDLAATSFELGIVVCGVLLLATPADSVTASGPGLRRFAAVGAAVVAGITCAALAATPDSAAGHHHQDAPGATPHDHAHG
jgi:hypothetical protein